MDLREQLVRGCRLPPNDKSRRGCDSFSGTDVGMYECVRVRPTRSPAYGASSDDSYDREDDEVGMRCRSAGGPLQPPPVWGYSPATPPWVPFQKSGLALVLTHFRAQGGAARGGRVAATLALRVRRNSPRRRCTGGLARVSCAKGWSA
jgi:hypothetical protein